MRSKPARIEQGESAVPRRALQSTLIALALAALADAACAAGAGPASAPAAGGHTPAAAKRAGAPIELIDINSASRDQLKTLPGIGDAQAQKIIAARPYFSKADLASKDVLPTGVYLSLKDRIIAKQKAKAPRKGEPR